MVQAKEEVGIRAVLSEGLPVTHKGQPCYVFEIIDFNTVQLINASKTVKMIAKIDDCTPGWHDAGNKPPQAIPPVPKSKFREHQAVILTDGTPGKVLGFDPSSGRYSIQTAQGGRQALFSEITGVFRG